jgi:hypothetical protein
VIWVGPAFPDIPSGPLATCGLFGASSTISLFVLCSFSTALICNISISLRSFVRLILPFLHFVSRVSSFKRKTNGHFRFRSFWSRQTRLARAFCFVSPPSHAFLSLLCLRPRSHSLFALTYAQSKVTNTSCSSDAFNCFLRPQQHSSSKLARLASRSKRELIAVNLHDRTRNIIRAHSHLTRSQAVEMFVS